MLGSQVLEVAIGLVFIFLALSAAASAIKEFIAGILGMRSKTLAQGIGNLLKDPVLTQKIFDHPLISGTAKPGSGPSYISSRNFALALLDVVAPPSAQGPRMVQDLQAGIANIPDAKVQKSLLTLVGAAQGNLELTQAKIEHWYDDAMDRVSGWYKRRAQIIIFFVGLTLCCALNGDTLMVLKELWNDQTMRETIGVQAKYQIEHPDAKGSDLSGVVRQIRAASTPPIGWLSSDPERGLPEGTGAWFLKVFGILISSLAITLGAPFWFDILNKLVNVRLAGEKPPDSRQT